MPEESLANLVGATQEGTQAFQEEEKETPPAPPAEEKTTEEVTPASGGEEDKASAESTDEEPSHEIPEKRFRKVIAERNELRERIAELETLKQEIEALKKSAPKPAEPIPDWFTESFGENPELWGKYRTYEEQRYAAIQQAAERRTQETLKAEREEANKWEGWVKGRLDKLAASGLEFDRNRLLKVALDYAPSDDDGNIDFEKAYKLMVKFDHSDKHERTEAKKKIATLTAPSGTEPEAQEFVTDADLKKLRWGSITI